MALVTVRATRNQLRLTAGATYTMDTTDDRFDAWLASGLIVVEESPSVPEHEPEVAVEASVASTSGDEETWFYGVEEAATEPPADDEDPPAKPKGRK